VHQLAIWARPLRSRFPLRCASQRSWTKRTPLLGRFQRDGGIPLASGRKPLGAPPCPVVHAELQSFRCDPRGSAGANAAIQDQRFTAAVSASLSRPRLWRSPPRSSCPLGTIHGRLRWSRCNHMRSGSRMASSVRLALRRMSSCSVNILGLNSDRSRRALESPPRDAVLACRRCHPWRFQAALGRGKERAFPSTSR
jgi:hypothetical protein